MRDNFASPDACAVVFQPCWERLQMNRVKPLLSMHGILLGYSSDSKHKAQRSYFWWQLKQKVHCPTHKWPLFTVESVMNLTFQTVMRSNLVKYYPVLWKTAESNDCGRIIATNREIFASVSIANNSFAPCAPSLIAVRLVQQAQLWPSDYQ